MVYPRQISPLRRVGLPKRSAENVGIAPNSLVVVAMARNSRTALLLRPAAGKNRGGVERRVGPTRQVTIPATLMQQVGWKIDEWVYVTEASRRRGLRLTSTAATTVTEMS